MHQRPIGSGQLRVKAGTPPICLNQNKKNYKGIWVHYWNSWKALGT